MRYGMERRIQALDQWTILIRLVIKNYKLQNHTSVCKGTHNMGLTMKALYQWVLHGLTVQLDNFFMSSMAT